MENLPKNEPVISVSHEAVVVGVSAGGLDALEAILKWLPVDFGLSVVIVQHLHPLQDGFFIQFLDRGCKIPVREAEEKESLEPGIVYLAPPNYHLLIEANKTFSLSVDEKVNYSRPSIDILFESAAEAYGPALIGVILTGASRDGAAGLRRIKENGGLSIVQDPQTAEFPTMPAAALAETPVDLVLELDQIGQCLAHIGQKSSVSACLTKR